MDTCFTFSKASQRADSGPRALCSTLLPQTQLQHFWCFRSLFIRWFVLLFCLFLSNTDADETRSDLKTPNFSISGNPTHFRTLPFNKEPQNEALVHLGLQLLTCVGSPVLTCIRGKLKAGDRPIGSFNCDVTLRALQGSPGSWMSVRMLSNHVCRLPHHPRELSSTFTHSLLGLKLKCDMSALDGLKSCRTKIVGDHYSCDHS